MTAFVYYLLKVMLCSGILFFYYHLALRNKVFHLWNRFYLLFAVFISIVLPMVQFTLPHYEDQSADAMRLLLILQEADQTLEALVIIGKTSVTAEQWLLVIFAMVSSLVFFRFCHSLVRIYRLIRSHQVNTIGGIRFVDTNAPGTPFSFFQYIFWNKKLSLQTETGQQVFQHERIHVEEKHSVDKVFIQLILVFFWCNPFFWLIRKEIHFIHEFIADQRSVTDKDADSFARMILQTVYHTQFASIINPFFQNSIKRRLVMLTKKQKPGLHYISRIIALPLIASVIFAFTVRSDTAGTTETANGLQEYLSTVPLFSPANTDTVPKKGTKEIRAVDVKKSPDKKVSAITITYTDGSKETMTAQEAEKKGLINKNDNTNTNLLKITAGNENSARSGKAPEDEQQPLFMLDGKEITKDEMNKIDPNSIEAVNVLKDKHATDKYGEKGKNGVVEITSKKSSNVRTEEPEKIFEEAENPASANQQEWRSFLEKNLQPLIENAAKKGAKPGTYTVNVRFLVKKDGSLADFVALNNPGYDLDKKVLAIMPNSPRWNPAIQNGHAVNAYHTQPISFVIQ